MGSSMNCSMNEFLELPFGLYGRHVGLHKEKTLSETPLRHVVSGPRSSTLGVVGSRIFGVRMFSVIDNPTVVASVLKVPEVFPVPSMFKWCESFWGSH